MLSVKAAVARAIPVSGEKLVLLSSLSLGHTVMHCLQHGWYIMIPSVKQHFGFNDVQYGAIDSVRSLSAAFINLPAGAATDLMKQRWVLILSTSLLGIGLAYFLLGIASSLALVMVAAALVGIAISLWHPPALSTLSARMPERLGLALSMHGMGGELGNTVGPLALGFLISAVGWRVASQTVLVPLVVMAIVLWLVLRNIPGREGQNLSKRQYAGALKELFKNKAAMGVVLARGVESMGTRSVLAFFPLYLQQDLGFSPPMAGAYYALMMGTGLISQPIMGHLSDTMGRKAVIVPSMVLLGTFTALLNWVGTGMGLIAVVVGIGLFVYALGAIIQAAAMDAPDEKTGAMTIGLLFASSAVFGIPSPVIAGTLSTAYGTTSVVFLYGGLAIIAAAGIMAVLPMRSGQGHAGRHH